MLTREYRVDYPADYICECVELGSGNVELHDIGLFDWMWCVVRLLSPYNSLLNVYAQEF
jgi:hypothetical protein